MKADGVRFLWCSVLSLGICFALAADDRKAEAVYQRGYALYQSEQYYEASECFQESALEATLPVIKANSLKAQIACYQMCNLLYREFKAIETLLDRYPEYADFTTLVEREFALAEAYFRGEREPAYWSLRWIPWLCDSDKSAEIYCSVLKRAPFAERSARARLRTAYLLDRQGKNKEANEQLRQLIEKFPDSPECQYAYLALANGLVNLAKGGDGDGNLAREATETLHEYQKKYPKSSEIPWTLRTLANLQDRRAKRLLELAEYYQKQGRKATAARYLAELIQNYPESTSTSEAEKRLAKLDSSFAPAAYREALPSRYPRFRVFNMPNEAEKVLLLPSESNGRFLVPVMDLYPDSDKAGKQPSSENKTAEKEKK